MQDNDFDAVFLNYLSRIDPKLDHLSHDGEVITLYTLDVSRASDFWHHFCDHLKHHRVHMKFLCPDPACIRETYEFASTESLHRA